MKERTVIAVMVLILIPIITAPLFKSESKTQDKALVDVISSSSSTVTTVQASFLEPEIPIHGVDKLKLENLNLSIENLQLKRDVMVESLRQEYKAEKFLYKFDFSTTSFRLIEQR